FRGREIAAHPRLEAVVVSALAGAGDLAGVFVVDAGDRGVAVFARSFGRGRGGAAVFRRVLGVLRVVAAARHDDDRSERDRDGDESELLHGATGSGSAVPFAPSVSGSPERICGYMPFV